MSSITQKNRLLEVSTPLGADKLILTGFSGKETVSQLFHFQAELFSQDQNIKAESLIGKSVNIYIKGKDDTKTRTFNGLVNRFYTSSRISRGGRHYRIELVPTFWLLTKICDCRIFQNKTTKQIIETLLKQYGCNDFQFKINQNLTPREYCVQYNESAFDFIMRLCIEDGIFYFFEHQDGKHNLIFADNTAAYQKSTEKNIQYRSGSLNQNCITKWDRLYQFIPGKWTQTDYNFEQPDTNLQTQTNSKVKIDNSNLEKYIYPGFYDQKDQGDSNVKSRIEAEEKNYDQIQATSSYQTFSDGMTFSLSDHELDSEKGEYVITEIFHQAHDDTHTAGSSGMQQYQNNFVCIPADQVCRPTVYMLKAKNYGLQSAVVVGPSQEEIYTDKYGRIKVQFYWDREGKKDENTSCWIRVAQTWAGNKWGSLFIPRVGQEVLISFLDGDIDRPIVIGSVYNANQMPPYDLPTNQTQSGIKTHSSKNGQATDANELRFEDKKDKEEIYLHAQKDFNRVVENDETQQIKHDQTITVKNDRTETVEEGNETIDIKKGNRAVTIDQGSETLNVKTGDRTVNVDQGNQTLNVKMGNRAVNVNTGNDSLTVKTGNRDVTINTGNNSVTLKMGNHSVNCNLGKISMSAMQGIELKVGANSIKIDQTGVTIEGMMVKINGQTMTQINANAMVQIKGAITMVN